MKLVPVLSILVIATMVSGCPSKDEIDPKIKIDTRKKCEYTGREKFALFPNSTRMGVFESIEIRESSKRVTLRNVVIATAINPMAQPLIFMNDWSKFGTQYDVGIFKVARLDKNPSNNDVLIGEAVNELVAATILDFSGSTAGVNVWNNTADCVVLEYVTLKVEDIKDFSGTETRSR